MPKGANKGRIVRRQTPFGTSRSSGLRAVRDFAQFGTSRSLALRASLTSLRRERRSFLPSRAPRVQIHAPRTSPLHNLLQGIATCVVYCWASCFVWFRRSGGRRGGWYSAPV